MDIFFVSSKIFWFFASPSNLIFFLAALALIFCLAGYHRLGQFVPLACVVGLGVFGLSPAASYLIEPLEDRFPVFKDDHMPVTGIILLDGAEQPEVGLARGLPAFSDAAERPMAFADLARRYPDAQLAIVGGGGIDGQVLSMMKASLTMLGVASNRVVFEDKSRITAADVAPRA